MKYVISCPLGTNVTEEARALHIRLASRVMQSYYEVSCKLDLRNEKLAFKPAGMPAYMDNYKSEYFSVLTLEYTGYGAYIDRTLRDLAEDYGLDYVEWTQDGSKYRISSAENFIAAYEQAYESAE